MTLPLLGDETHAAQHRRIGAVGELHIGEFDPRLGQCQRRQVVVIRLAGRAVDYLVEHAHADQVVVEIDIETSKTLRRLIGEQERRQEGAEFAGHRAGIDDAVTGIDRRQRDGEAAEHFHQRTGAVGDARHLVGFVLDRTDADGEPAPHLVFEREGLDHAHALQRLLHGLDDLRASR